MPHATPPAGADRAAPPTRTIGLLLIPGFALMSYASAVEPLRAANVLSGRTLYRWSHIAPDGNAVTASNGATILADHRVGGTADFDTVLVCAGGNPATFRDPATLAWLRHLARRGRRVGGISGGPYVVARAGLLDGYRCTIHWEHIPAFLEEFPEARIFRTLYEIDGTRLTCAGGIAALDLMLAFIAADHGPALANAVSDWFLHGRVRQGSGPQRMDLRERTGVSHPRLLKAMEAMEAAIETPLTSARIAAVAGLSQRHLERLFARHLGTTLADHYLGLRLDHARALLRQTTLSLAEVAVACGFASASHFSRRFKGRFGHPPGAERPRALPPQRPGRR
ncbi:GlxA family transcriptional regulator [Azospirillum sp. ST 5-10]|uniref:GlxA family transcriptional regulator n=1 Tax=unclassified Azospirillum TaxID=2630922 RepID=UPI003F4A6592